MTARLPDSCAACTHFLAVQPDQGGMPRNTGTCRRHAPSTGTEPFELVHWPAVGRDDRCGVGAEVGDETPQPVLCNACRHWQQPVIPDYRQGRSQDWWQQAGLCRRFGPSPSAEESRRVRWRVTHALDRCGDSQDADEDEAQPEATAGAPGTVALTLPAVPLPPQDQAAPSRVLPGGADGQRPSELA